MKMMKFEKNKAQENVTKHLLGNYTVCSHLQRVVWANLHSFNVINKQQGKVYFHISCVQMYININILWEEKDKQITSSSLQVCFVVAHSSG